MFSVLFVSAFSFLINIPLGIWREHYKRLSLQWLVVLHLSVPIIIILRIYLKVSPYFIPLFIALAISGQLLGVRMKRDK